MKKKPKLAMTLMATAMLAMAARGGNPELPVGLGTAGDFVILGKTGITTDPASTITGDMGVSPIDSTAITGFALTMDSSGEFSTSAQVTGKIYASDYGVPTPSKMSLAITDMEAAYTQASLRTLPDDTEVLGGLIGGHTFTPGLYKWGTDVSIDTDIWLDAQGNPDAVFIFQIAGNLTVASAQSVFLLGGAQAKNIFWQVEGLAGAVVGTTAHVEGIILTAKKIDLLTGATFNGKLLAQTAVNLQGNTILDSDLIAPPLVRLEIISEHGTGTPPTGVYFNVIGTLLTNSITASETFGSTQYVNTGWIMIGNEPLAGPTNSMNMVHTNDAVLTWLWSTNYLLNASNSPNGSLTGSTNGFYIAGSTVVITAVPNIGYQFIGWTGDVSGPTNEPVLTLTMDGPKSVTAIFGTAFIDVSSLVTWNVDWVCDPCRGFYIGTLTIANNNSPKPLMAPFWFEVQSTPQYYLRKPTGVDTNTGMSYVDISIAVANQLVVTGDGDLALDPGESVTITGIELIGDFPPTALVMAVWADPPAAVVASHAVGVPFEMPLPEAFADAANVKVSGLPQGMKYNATTRMITGVPLKPGAFGVVISAAGVPTQTVILGIGSLPKWAAGAFTGYAEGGGVASMTVSAQGKVTGKLASGGKSYMFTAASYAEGGNSEEGFVIDAVAKDGLALLPLTLRVTQAVAPAPSALSVAAGQVGGGVPVVLYHDVWAVAGAVLAPYIGYYTATLPGNEEHGSGYLTFTVDKAGKIKVAGKLADSTAVSASGTLILDDAGRVWAVVYTAPNVYKGGSLFGLAEFVMPADGAVYLRPLGGGVFRWQNFNVQATSVYGEGFDRELTLSGGWFDKIGNLNHYYNNKTLAVGTDADAVAPELWIGNAAYGAVGWNPDGIALAVTADKPGTLTGIAAPQAGVPLKVGGVWDYGADNSLGLKVKLNRATGVFDGSFKAWFDYAAAHTPKNIAFTGVLTPEREDKADGIAGRGFFLWADKAQFLNPQNKTIPYSFKWSYDLKILLSEPSL